MIARFQVLLPFQIFTKNSLVSEADPEEVVLGDLRALIFPPHRSQLQVGDVSGESGAPPNEIPRRLDPVSPQPQAFGVQIGGDGAVACDVLRIDFHKDNFNRDNDADDPPVALAFQLANSWIRRLRVLNRVFYAKILVSDRNSWSIQFLNDDETELDPSPGKVRRRLASASQFQVTALDESIWNATKSLPVNYELEPSDELLLDAYGQLPQVGPAIVLAYTAIETRIARALDRLASLVGMNPVLWGWINDRGNFIKDPSTAEQLDVLAKVLIGKSLKEEAQLWEGYQQLRQARNGFVHSGKAATGKQQVEVDSARATELVQMAERIIDWIENLLPQPERRPRFQSPNSISVTQLLGVMPVQVTEASGSDADSTNVAEAPGEGEVEQDS